MKLPADAVALVFADDFQAPRAGEVINRLADVADPAARFDRVNPFPEGFKRYLHEPPGFVGHFPDEKSFRLVAVPAVDDGRQIHVDDVAVLQRAGIGNAVADDFVHAGANAFGKALVAQAGGNVPVGAGVFLHEAVEFFGRHAGFDVRPDVIHQLGIEPRGLPQMLPVSLIINRGFFHQHNRFPPEGFTQTCEANVQNTERHAL